MREFLKRITSRILPDRYVRAVQAGRGSLAGDRWHRNRAQSNALKVGELIKLDRPICVDLGAGGRKTDGWTSVDWNDGNDLLLDISKPLPFPDCSVDRIYSSHTFEHFSYPEPMTMILGECRRILVPGGRLEIAVPDASIYICGYAENERFDIAKWCVVETGRHGLSRIDCVNYMAYMGGEHRHMFDTENLIAILRRADFADAAVREFNPKLDMAERRFESLYVGASKQKA